VFPHHCNSRVSVVRVTVGLGSSFPGDYIRCCTAWFEKQSKCNNSDSLWRKMFCFTCFIFFVETWVA